MASPFCLRQRQQQQQCKHTALLVLTAAAALAAFLQPTAHAADTAVQRLDTATVAALWRAGYGYLDVRTKEENAAGRVPGSLNVPWAFKGPDGQQQLNLAFVKDVRALFPDRASRFIVACQTGRRSVKAAQALAPLYPNMVESKEGFVGWLDAGLPVVRDTA